jgi:Fur family transcriptional regulator, ferric uptake regulator
MSGGAAMARAIPRTTIGWPGRRVSRGRRLGPMTRTWHEELRSRGYRVTPQRQLVLEAVNKLEHATPEDICAEVRQTARGVNISTVYRTLELLEQLGLVTHTHLGHGAPTYHLAAQADHVHLVCRDCSKVTEISPDTVRGLVSALEREHGFETDVGHLTVFGRCARCRADGGARRRAATN